MFLMRNGVSIFGRIPDFDIALLSLLAYTGAMVGLLTGLLMLLV
jgi:hypothetical protein